MNPIRIRLNGPMAIVLSVLIMCAFGTWLVLLLTHTIEFYESMKFFGSWLAGLATGALIPVINMWRDKKLTFDIDSDPPKGNANGAA